MNDRFTDEEREDLDTEMYKKWKWNHLRVAFEKLGFIEEGTPKESFANPLRRCFLTKQQKLSSAVFSVTRSLPLASTTLSMR